MDALGGNVEVAGRLYEAFGRRDVDALTALLDPGVERELVGPSEIRIRHSQKHSPPATVLKNGAHR
jgi:ketosteroid isomerase-like protein